MPASPPPCCEYYGYLPKLICRSTLPAPSPPIMRATSPLATARSDLPTNAVLNKPPSTYTLSEPLTFSFDDLPPKPRSSLRLVIISDTHERHRDMLLPHGDVLVHCGDIQEGFNFIRRVDVMLADFAAWFNDSALHPHPVKLVIAGNHDQAISQMSTEAARKLFSPALYLCEESAVIEPAGLRFYGTPRSISNSVLSPNKAFQSRRWWRPFMQLPSEEEKREEVEHSVDDDEARLLRVRLEGNTPRGPVDVLMVHQSPDTPRPRHVVEEQPICTLAQQVAPRRVLLCGHLHGAHGMHRLPTPLAVREEMGLAATPPGSSVGDIPFLPCINAAMMLGGFHHAHLLPASVVDVEI